MSPKKIAESLHRLADKFNRIEDQNIYCGMPMVCVMPDTLDQMLSAAKHIGGRWKKISNDKNLFLRQEDINIFMPHERVCKKVVSERTLPAEPERILPALPERTVEDVTWECPDSLLEAAKGGK